jgi:hypothetical protein
MGLQVDSAIEAGVSELPADKKESPPQGRKGGGEGSAVLEVKLAGTVFDTPLLRRRSCALAQLDRKLIRCCFEQHQETDPSAFIQHATKRR